MADILLSFGVSQTDGDVKDIRKGLESIITKIEQNPPKVRVGLTVDNDALNHFKKELEAILNTVSLANGAPITLNIRGLGEISAQATQAAGAMKKATGSVKQQGSALSTVLQKYEQAHALLRKNANANDSTSQSYKGLAAQVQFFETMLEKAHQESIDISVAFARSGVDVSAAIQNMTTAMSAFRAEMEHTGTSGTVTAKQLYDMVAKMREAVAKNKNAYGLDSYKAITDQLGDWEAAVDLVKQGSATVEQALSLIGNSSDSANVKIVGMATALSSLNEEMKRTGTSGTTTKAQIDDTLSQANRLLQSNGNAFELKSFTELQTLLSKLAPLMQSVKADGSDLFSKLEQGGFEASTVVKTLQDAMQALKTEISTTGQSGTVTAKQLYDVVTQMESLLSANKGASGFESYTNLNNQFTQLSAAMELVRDGGLSVEEAFRKIGIDGSSALDQARTSMSALRTQLSEVTKVTGTQLLDTYRDMKSLLSDNPNASGLDTYKVLAQQVADFEAKIIDSSGNIRSAEDILKQFGNTATAAFTGSKEKMSAFRAEMEHTGTSGRTKMETLEQQIRRLDTIIQQTESDLKKWSKARGGKTSENYKAIEQEVEALKQMRSHLASTGQTMDDFGSKVGKAAAIIRTNSTAIKDAGEDTKSLSDIWGSLAGKFGSWLTVSQTVMAALRAVKKMVSTVVELDSAMTELKKVTDETDATYERFLNKAADRSKTIGASLSDVVSATSEFARLGYGINDASKLADVALMYNNIGDGVENVTQASESIVSTMQAFGMLPTQAEHIVDVFNSVGNKFAISSGGLGEALQRSAAAMNAAGNTLEETAALVAAANTVVQDPDSVGTTLKTVSMFLRASKVEAEEAGESTDGMANSVSELREKLLSLTKGRVDILTDSGQYKSTYEILKDIASVWDDIVNNQGTDSAAILELIGGKRNSNVVAAILENFDIAEDALAVALNSAGSAAEENAKHLESISGRISQFQAAWESLSQTVVNNDIVKNIVSFGTAIVSTIDKIAQFSGSLGFALTLIPTVVGAYTKFDKVKNIVDGLLTSVKSFAGGAK